MTTKRLWNTSTTPSQGDLFPRPETLVRVVGHYFVAGFVVRDGCVIHAAPILTKFYIGGKLVSLVGKTENEARTIIYECGWKATICRPYSGDD